MSDEFVTDRFAELWDRPGFTDNAEKLGLIEIVPVTKRALESSFAAERGIEPGGFMWQLTQRGHERYNSCKGVK